MSFWSGARAFVDNEEAMRAVSAGLVLLGVFGLAAYYAIVSSTPSIEATKLTILGPSEYRLVTEAELTIKAVDDEGTVDSNRSDLIRISTDPRSHAQLGISSASGIIWSSSLTLNLEAGLCKVKFLDSKSEKVLVSVEWLEGESPLMSDAIELSCGWPGF